MLLNHGFEGLLLFFFLFFDVPKLSKIPPFSQSHSLSLSTSRFMAESVSIDNRHIVRVALSVFLFQVPADVTIQQDQRKFKS